MCYEIVAAADGEEVVPQLRSGHADEPTSTGHPEQGHGLTQE
jgi:hypothetical protein